MDDKPEPQEQVRGRLRSLWMTRDTRDPATATYVYLAALLLVLDLLPTAPRPGWWNAAVLALLSAVACGFVVGWWRDNADSSRSAEPSKPSGVGIRFEQLVLIGAVGAVLLEWQPRSLMSRTTLTLVAGLLFVAMWRAFRQARRGGAPPSASPTT